jgi:hypothetical protein
MKSDIVKPMPAKAPAQASCRQLYSADLVAACAYSRCGRQEDADRLSYNEASDDRGHKPTTPNEDARVRRHVRINQREHRKDSVARQRAGGP